MQKKQAKEAGKITETFQNLVKLILTTFLLFRTEFVIKSKERRIFRYLSLESRKKTQK